MKKLIIATALILASASQVWATDNIEAAKTFIKALQNQDLETVEAMVADNIAFEDPTWGASYKGRQNVMQVYKVYTGGVGNIKGYVMDAFESNNTVVLNYMVYANIKLKTGGLMPIMGQSIRIVGFKDGKVVRHTDLADYSRMMRLQAEAEAAAEAKLNNG